MCRRRRRHHAQAMPPSLAIPTTEKTDNMHQRTRSLGLSLAVAMLLLAGCATPQRSDPSGVARRTVPELAALRPAALNASIASQVGERAVFEAEAALRQAQKLMLKHGIDIAELAASSGQAPRYDWCTVSVPASEVALRPA